MMVTNELIKLWGKILAVSNRLRDAAAQGAINEITALLEARENLMNQVEALPSAREMGKACPELEGLVRETLELQRETEGLLEKKLAGLSSDIRGIESLRRGTLSYLKSGLSGKPLILDRRD